MLTWIIGQMQAVLRNLNLGVPVLLCIPIITCQHLPAPKILCHLMPARIKNAGIHMPALLNYGASRCQLVPAGASSFIL